MALFAPPANASVSSQQPSSEAVAVWLRTEPFVFASLPIAPHSKLTFGHIKKILGYLRSKSPQTFPKMNFQMWQHITVHKMAIPAELGQIYYETFLHYDSSVDSVGEPTSVDQAKLAQNQGPWVDARRFVVFLMLQHLHKISLRSSLQGGEEWPARCRSPDVDQRQQMSNRSFDENAHQSFFLNNLEDILVALQDPTLNNPNQSSSNDLKSPRPTLSWASIRALDYVLCGSPDQLKTIMPFSQLFRNSVNGEQQSKASVVVSENTYLLRNVESYIRSHMAPNPFGLVACSLNGKRLVWPFQGEDRDVRLERGGKILTNSHIVADAIMPVAGPSMAATSDFFKVGNKVVAILQVNRQTLARQSTTLAHSILRISRCQSSSIYPIAALRACLIDKCRSSNIVFGAIQTTLYVTGCENITVSAACRRLVVVNCINCTFYLLTPTSPLIIGNNEGITLAPYNIVHPLLTEQLTAVALPAKPNKWDEYRHPLPDWSSSATNDNNSNHPAGGDGAQPQHTTKVMDPAEFCLGRIPFELEGPDSNSRLLVKLPPVYQAALDAAEEQLAKWTANVRRVLTRTEQRDELEAFTMRHFKEWLVSTGNSVHIESLTVKALPQSNNSTAVNGSVSASKTIRGNSANANTNTNSANANNASNINNSSNNSNNNVTPSSSSANQTGRDRVEVLSLE